MHSNIKVRQSLIESIVKRSALETKLEDVGNQPFGKWTFCHWRFSNSRRDLQTHHIICTTNSKASDCLKAHWPLALFARKCESRKDALRGRRRSLVRHSSARVSQNSRKLKMQISAGTTARDFNADCAIWIIFSKELRVFSHGRELV